ncbi:MAG: hypothetical protein M1838_005215 [Thelocarpon superellum]|nr:MAG: hypothetical protein M1838_005215 [Thelocarpon superellum]
MSEHGKSFQTNLPGYPSTSSFQDDSYLYAPSGYGSQSQFAQGTEPAVEDAEAPPVIIDPSYQPRLTFQEPQPPPPRATGPAFVDLRSRPPPQIQSFSPPEGGAGTKLFVYVYSTYPLTTAPAVSLLLVFGTKICASTIAELASTDQFFRYVVTADAPGFEATGWVDPEVALYLRLEDEAGQALGTVEVGEFSYAGSKPALPVYASPHTAARKRKSSQNLDSDNAPVKRTSTQHMRMPSREEAPTFSYTPVQNPPFSPYLHASSAAESYPIQGRYDQRPPGPGLYRPHASPQQLSYGYSKPVHVRQPSLKAPSPQTPSWSPSYTSMSSQTSRSPRLSTTSISTRSTLATIPSPVNAANPPLIRTSTLQHPPSPAAAATGAMQAGSAFNPYAMYPHKAVLDIRGDLDSMADDWTPDETAAKRRLVQFRRKQSGNTIHTSFKPIGQDDRPSQSICISCILWEEKEECFVTSVDTIYLLESLVAVRFTVEEKNRIRRNLEGFRPLTVSKAKPDSENFFKVIMGFPNPKPRNIEKDVKVFPWKILAHALKKIIGKYSASYSSTAGALVTGPSASYDETGSGGFHFLDSGPGQELSTPPSMSSAGPSHLYLADASGATPVGRLPGGKAEVSDLRLTIPPLPQPSIPATRWGQPGPYAATPQHPAGSVPTSRGGWDLSAYMEANPGTATPSEAHHLYYPRSAMGDPSLPGPSNPPHPMSRI